MVTLLNITHACLSSTIVTKVFCHLFHSGGVLSDQVQITAGQHLSALCLTPGLALSP